MCGYGEAGLPHLIMTSNYVRKYRLLNKQKFAYGIITSKTWPKILRFSTNLKNFFKREIFDTPPLTFLWMFVFLQAAEELKVNVSQLQQKLLQRPGIISASDQPVFMSEFEEDDVVNWIHDVTDLGWGINDIHICQRIKVFLSEHSYSVLFDSSSPINYPSTDWLCGQFMPLCSYCSVTCFVYT